MRALEILEGRTNGHALPILRLLAARNFAPAMNALVDFLPPRAALRLQRRAAAKGDEIGLYNLAIEHRNRGSLSRYRHWLARAARVSPEARHELRQFRVRFPHTCMKRWRRFAEERP
ncbi:hypothetical protein ACFOMD_17725 [Sphingoaurantiacus capsulatus]|uniref:Uncharacterized protein n=1 Tax=Sphingoaurantiacus capsulatus TaxID=1771310 RepID=A0ABV7XHG5_9SPHN